MLRTAKLSKINLWKTSAVLSTDRYPNLLFKLTNYGIPGKNTKLDKVLDGLYKICCTGWGFTNDSGCIDVFNVIVFIRATDHVITMLCHL